MKIRMKVDISGTRNGEPWPARGETIDLPTDEAQSLIDSNMAEAVAKAKAESARQAREEQKRLADQQRAAARAEKARPAPQPKTETELKAARDARYAARKNRK